MNYGKLKDTKQKRQKPGEIKAFQYSNVNQLAEVFQCFLLCLRNDKLSLKTQLKNLFSGMFNYKLKTVVAKIKIRD